MIYLLGGSGYLGKAFQRLLHRRGVRFKSVRRGDLDYFNSAVLAAALRSDHPDFLINAAGYVGLPNVDACELHKAECLFANAVLPGRIGEACLTAGVPWGHVSSGCIYEGSRRDGQGFRESDPPNFTFRQDRCSFYSGTKALAEEILLGYPDLYIWRLRMPFHLADHPRNYLSKIMQYERLLNVANSLSELDEFAAASFACWERRAPPGIYNVTNPGIATTQEIVAQIHRSGVCRKDFRFFENEAEFMRTAARAPRSHCTLDSSKLAALGIALTEVHDAIDRDLRQWQAGS